MPDTPADDRERRPRTAILTVDDDPSVSRAVARDLRRQYGSTHRIVRADSGSDALATIRELVRRGDEVAVLLADHRMPGMTGVEFLEAAMDLVPRARRALLTAYADTDAAIQAINVVDVDHYLLKPWQPPEEKLYPVVDQMLEAYAASAAPPRGVRLVGHRWSAPSHDLRDFLARNQVPYAWVDVEHADGRRLLAACEADESSLPVLVFDDGSHLVTPTRTEVADRVGLSTSASTDLYDVVVVGGGPGGLGAAVYAQSEGLRTLLVEKDATGGQAGQSSRIENYLGFPDGVSGSALTDRARRQAERFGTEIVSTREVVSIAPRGPVHEVVLDDDTSVAARSVVLATGVSYRRLRADGADAMVGRGVYYGAAATQGDATRDCSVVIVGGANSAGQAAMHFSQFADRVTIAVRGDSIERSMSQYLVDQIAGRDNIEVRTRTVVQSCAGDGHLETVTLCTETPDGLVQTEITCGHVFVFIGAAPRTDWLPVEVRRDEGGFVLTGADLTADGRPPGWHRDPYPLESSVPGVFVVGDVRSGSVKRVASAVGEGAMAVSLVHRHLAQS